jgi:hypothetical protein
MAPESEATASIRPMLRLGYRHSEFRQPLPRTGWLHTGHACMQLMTPFLLRATDTAVGGRDTHYSRLSNIVTGDAGK